MKSKRTKATRKITMLLAMTMLSEQLVSTGAVLYAHAEDVTSAEYTIEHGVTSSWDGGCTAEIILTNKADVDTEKWSVSFCTCDEITNLWGGQITDCQEITESYYGEGRVEVFEENKEEVLSETDNYREETEVAPLEDEVDKETEASEDVASEEKINDTEEAETDFTDVLEEKAEEEAYAVLSEEALEVDIVEFDETEVFKEIEDEAKHYYSYTVECLDYNAAIPAGGSVRIGYSANGKEHDIWEKKATIEFKKDEVEEKTIPVGGIYVGEGYTVEVVVPAYWENAYNVQLKITNISEEIIHNWAFVMETADDIVNLYNAVELSNKEGVRLIKNVGYNQDIPVGGTIEVGYTASYEKNADVPSGFALSQIETEVTTDECEVSIFITDEWGNGGLAQIAIKNNSELPIEDWMIKFDSALDIKEIWGGVIESHEGEHYFIRNAEYAQNIAVGESWTVGILFSGDMLDMC